MSKIYLLSQDDNGGYDTYDSCVVCADNIEEAKYIHPSEYYKYHDGKLWFQFADGTEKEEEPNYDFDGWATPDKVKVKLIGTATDDIEVGKVVCASFNAG